MAEQEREGLRCSSKGEGQEGAPNGKGVGRQKEAPLLKKKKGRLKRCELVETGTKDPCTGGKEINTSSRLPSRVSTASVGREEEIGPDSGSREGHGERKKGGCGGDATLCECLFRESGGRSSTRGDGMAKGKMESPLGGTGEVKKLRDRGKKRRVPARVGFHRKATLRRKRDLLHGGGT